MLAVPLVVTVNALAALVAGQGRARAAGAVACSLSAFGVLLLLPPPFVALRGWAWLGAFFLTMRLVDVLGDAQAGTPLPPRLILAFSILDPREFTPARPALVPRQILSAIANFVASVAGYVAVLLAPRSTLLVAPGLAPVVVFTARWAAGVVFFVCGLAFLGEALAIAFRAVGLASPPLQNAPLRSRSLSEFWGRRWNRVVGRWLHRWCFVPLARRGRPSAGAVLAFGYSAFFHAVATWAAVGSRLALSMCLFFLVQGLFTLLERPLRVATWPPAVARAWTFGVFAVTLPLFLEPALALMAAPAPVVPGQG